MKKVFFKKLFRNENYEMLFDSKTGLEIIQGVNGKEDPFQLALPSLLDIGIMGHCENKCYFCYQGHKTEPNMSLDDFKWIIDHVKGHTNQVALGGRGDPNQHENFREIIEYCMESRIVPNYTTSGIGLTDEQIEISKLCGAVAISDYSRPFTYSALRRLMDAGIKTNIHQIFGVDSYNKCMDIISGTDVWLSQVDLNRLNAVIFLLYKAAGEGKLHKYLSPSSKQKHTFLTNLLNPKCKFKVGMDSCLANHIFSSGIQISELQKMSIDTCEGARMSGYISPSMKLSPCSFSENPDYEVDLRKQNFDYCWNSSVSFNNFRGLLVENPYKCPLGL